MISASQRQHYLEQGYLVVEDVISARRLTELRQALEKRFEREGELAGAEGVDNPGVRRLCNLLSKGPAFEALAVEPVALAVAALTIGDDIRWQAMNFHDPLPGATIAHQAIHADRSFFANCTGYITIAWAIDDMTEQNGATRIVPGSHKRPWPCETSPDPREVVPGEIYAECRAGAAVFIHGDVWHGGRANRSTTTRRVIHLGFSCSLTAPQYEITATLSAATRRRLGRHCAMLPGTLSAFGLSGGPFENKNVDAVMKAARSATHDGRA